ncbi:MAG: DNA-binding beta-propeller fold protein YncE [bacterium]|jgi:DNA-binding beta-propeller fold protein YncE
MKNVPDPVDATKTIKVKDAYKDLVMFHFDNQGQLKAQYGIKRDKNNKWSKSILTPQDVALSGDGKSLYWTYGELKGMRQGVEIGGGLLELTGGSTLSKSKLLYYPAVARIDLEAGTIGDFVPLGADENGKQIYYTNPEFPSLMSPDRTNLTFIGESKNGKTIWLGRMNLE